MTITVGIILGHFDIFDEAFIKLAVQCVFCVALPCLGCRGLGIYVNFYSNKFIWEFFLALLILKAIALFFSFLSIFICQNKSTGGGIGDIDL
jgi:predicted permease